MPSKKSSDSTQFNERFEYISLDDFTPGIYSRGTAAVTAGAATKARLGAAQLTGTFACRATPEGALEPLPKMITTYDLPNPDVLGNLVAGYYNVSGFFGFGPVGPPAANASGSPDDLFVFMEWLKAGGTRNYNYYRINLDSTLVPVDTLVSSSDAVAVTAQQYNGLTFVTSRINPNSPYLTPGTPVVATSWAPPGFPSDKHMWIFPNPSAPGVTAVLDLVDGAAAHHFGDLIGHQSRIVLLEYITNQFGGNSGDAIPSNEQVSWTEPANSPLLGPVSVPQDTIFTAESPNGYGAWGSISAGELFLVKQWGGGAIVTGDLDTPTVTRLPGVVSTKGISNRAASTKDGLFYYSRYNGAYIWRGADTSEKISSQLDDQFPLITGQANLLTQNICWQDWQDMVLCSNLWVYDLVTKSWWQLDAPQTPPIQWYGASFDGEIIYACPLQVTPAQTSGAIRVYRRTTPANTYSWQGHPVPASLERYLDIREIILLAQGNGTVTITIQSTTGTRVETFTFNNNNQPIRMRQLTEAVGYNVIIKIVSTGAASGPAPVVYSVDIGCREQVFATNP